LLERKILRRRILRPEDSSLGVFFARSILRRIILRSKKALAAEISSPDDSSLGKFLARERFRYHFVYLNYSKSGSEKNYPGGEYSGEESFTSGEKNLSEESSGEESPGEELYGEESSGEELFGEEFSGEECSANCNLQLPGRTLCHYGIQTVS
jgi:hypothetical protein